MSDIGIGALALRLANGEALASIIRRVRELAWHEGRKATKGAINPYADNGPS